MGKTVSDYDSTTSLPKSTGVIFCDARFRSVPEEAEGLHQIRRCGNAGHHSTSGDIRGPAHASGTGRLMPQPFK